MSRKIEITLEVDSLFVNQLTALYLLLEGDNNEIEGLLSISPGDAVGAIWHLRDILEDHKGWIEKWVNRKELGKRRALFLDWFMRGPDEET